MTAYEEGNEEERNDTDVWVPFVLRNYCRKEKSR